MHGTINIKLNTMSQHLSKQYCLQSAIHNSKSRIIQGVKKEFPTLLVYSTIVQWRKNPRKYMCSLFPERLVLFLLALQRM